MIMSNRRISGPATMAFVVVLCCCIDTGVSGWFGHNPNRVRFPASSTSQRQTKQHSRIILFDSDDKVDRTMDSYNEAINRAFQQSQQQQQQTTASPAHLGSNAQQQQDTTMMAYQAAMNQGRAVVDASNNIPTGTSFEEQLDAQRDEYLNTVNGQQHPQASEAAKRPKRRSSFRFIPDDGPPRRNKNNGVQAADTLSVVAGEEQQQGEEPGNPNIVDAEWLFEDSDQGQDRPRDHEEMKAYLARKASDKATRKANAEALRISTEETRKAERARERELEKELNRKSEAASRESFSQSNEDFMRDKFTNSNQDAKQAQKEFLKQFAQENPMHNGMSSQAQAAHQAELNRANEDFLREQSSHVDMQAKHAQEEYLQQHGKSSPFSDMEGMHITDTAGASVNINHRQQQQQQQQQNANGENQDAPMNGVPPQSYNNGMEVPPPQVMPNQQEEEMGNPYFGVKEDHFSTPNEEAVRSEFDKMNEDANQAYQHYLEKQRAYEEFLQKQQDAAILASMSQEERDARYQSAMSRDNQQATNNNNGFQPPMPQHPAQPRPRVDNNMNMRQSHEAPPPPEPVKVEDMKSSFQPIPLNDDTFSGGQGQPLDPSAWMPPKSPESLEQDQKEYVKYVRPPKPSSSEGQSIDAVGPEEGQDHPVEGTTVGAPPTQIDNEPIAQTPPTPQETLTPPEKDLQSLAADPPSMIGGPQLHAQPDPGQSHAQPVAQPQSEAQRRSPGFVGFDGEKPDDTAAAARAEIFGAQQQSSASSSVAHTSEDIQPFHQDNEPDVLDAKAKIFGDLQKPKQTQEQTSQTPPPNAQQQQPSSDPYSVPKIGDPAAKQSPEAAAKNPGPPSERNSVPRISDMPLEQQQAFQPPKVPYEQPPSDPFSVPRIKDMKAYKVSGADAFQAPPKPQPIQQRRAPPEQEAAQAPVQQQPAPAANKPAPKNVDTHAAQQSQPPPPKQQQQQQQQGQPPASAKKDKAFIPPFPNLGSFGDEADEFDAYGNKKRKAKDLVADEPSLPPGMAFADGGQRTEPGASINAFYGDGNPFPDTVDPSPFSGSAVNTGGGGSTGSSTYAEGYSEPPPTPEISCVIESYSDLPSWVLESQKTDPKKELVDSEFVKWAPNKPREAPPPPVEVPKGKFNEVVDGKIPQPAADSSWGVDASDGASDDAAVPGGWDTPPQQAWTPQTEEQHSSPYVGKVTIEGGGDKPANPTPQPRAEDSSPGAQSGSAKAVTQTPPAAGSVGGAQASKQEPSEPNLSSLLVEKATAEAQHEGTSGFDMFETYMDLMAPPGDSTQSSEEEPQENDASEDIMDVFNAAMAPHELSSIPLSLKAPPEETGPQESVEPNLQHTAGKGSKERQGIKKVQTSHKAMLNDNTTANISLNATGPGSDTIAHPRTASQAQGQAKGERLGSDSGSHASKLKTKESSGSETNVERKSKKVSLPWVGEVSVPDLSEDVMSAFMESMQPDENISIPVAGELSIEENESVSAVGSINASSVSSPETKGAMPKNAASSTRAPASKANTSRTKIAASEELPEAKVDMSPERVSSALKDRAKVRSPSGTSNATSLFERVASFLEGKVHENEVATPAVKPKGGWGWGDEPKTHLNSGASVNTTISAETSPASKQNITNLDRKESSNLDRKESSPTEEVNEAKSIASPPEHQAAPRPSGDMDMQLSYDAPPPSQHRDKRQSFDTPPCEHPPQPRPPALQDDLNMQQPVKVKKEKHSFQPIPVVDDLFSGRQGEPLDPQAWVPPVTESHGEQKEYVKYTRPTKPSSPDGQSSEAEQGDDMSALPPQEASTENRTISLGKETASKDFVQDESSSAAAMKNGKQASLDDSNQTMADTSIVGEEEPDLDGELLEALDRDLGGALLDTPDDEEKSGAWSTAMSSAKRILFDNDEESESNENKKNRGNQDGANAPFFVDLKKPTVLMIDLESKNGTSCPSLLVSRDTDIVETIMQDKPELSKNVYDAIGGLLISGGTKEGDDAIEVPLDVLEPSCVTGQILKRTELSKGYSGWTAFQKLEKEWNSLKASKTLDYDSKWTRKVQNGVPPPYQFVTEDPTFSHPRCWEKLRVQRDEKLDHDIIVAGGPIGIFFAMALQLKGLDVCIVDGANFEADDSEWKIEADDLLKLLGLGILTEEDIEAATTVSSATELETKDVSSLRLSPSTLIKRVALRFKKGGGHILSHTPMMGIAVSEYSGVAVDLGEEKDPLTATLIIDAMGSTSPMSRQKRYGETPDKVCAVVGSMASGFDDEFKSDVENIPSALKLRNSGDTRKPQQYFWESSPAGSGKARNGFLGSLPSFDLDADANNNDTKTTYMFTYMDANGERPSFESMMADYWTMLSSRQPSLKDPVADLDVKRVMFAYYPIFSSKPHWNRILDIDSIQSPFSSVGLGSVAGHIGRISNAVKEALESDCLHKDDLAEIVSFNPPNRADILATKLPHQIEHCVEDLAPREKFKWLRRLEAWKAGNGSIDEDDKVGSKEE